MSQCLKVARHGLKVAQRVLHVLCPDLRAGFCQALRFHSAEASELYSGERCLFERERSARFPSRRHLLPKLLFLILLVLWGYDGPYGGGCYAFGSVGFGCWNNNGFGRSMGAMGSYSPSHGSIGIPSPRCTSYSHGSIGIQQSRCTSYHHFSLAIPQSRCTSYHHGSIGIHSYRCTSYVSASPSGYYAKRWFEYGASGSGGATNQVCCQTGRRKAFRLCQLIEVGINVGPQISGRAYGTTTTSSAAASSGGPPNIGGPISVPAWDQFSTASSSGLSPQEYAALNRMPMGSSEPEVREWPKFLRVRVSGDLNYTKVLTGNAAERSAGCIPLDYRPAPEVEAIPGPTVVGEKYLLVCERSLQLEREWAEAKLIVKEEYPAPPSYVNARVVPMQRLGAGSHQTFCNGPHWDYRPINEDRGLDASKLHPKPKRRDRCPSKDARGSPLDGVHKYVAALQRDASVSPGDAIESIGGRNRGGVPQLCCFEQYTCSIHRLLRLSGLIWGWSDQTTLIYPSIGTCASSETTAYFGSRGTGSWPGAIIGCCCYHYDGAGDYVSPRQCLGDRTAEVYWLAFATAKGGGAFTLRDPGFPPPVKGLSLSEQIGRYLSLTSLLSEQMRWYTTRGLVVPEWCARHISLLHRKIHELQQSFHIQQTGAPP